MKPAVLSVEDAQSILGMLMSRECVAGEQSHDAIGVLGQLIDLSGSLNRADGLQRALKWCAQLVRHDLSSEDQAILHYFWANAWAEIYNHQHMQPGASTFWECKECGEQILHLRNALSGDGFRLLSRLRQCQILTNLANVLSHVGRPVEAAEYYTRALSIDRAFPMAIGNRGHCLRFYGWWLSDEGHRAMVLRRAWADLSVALNDPQLDEHAKSPFRASKTSIERALGDNVLVVDNLDGYDLGDAEEEAYRRWSLVNALFLNPLNDLGPYRIAAADTLSVPGIVVPLEDGPYYIGFFDQMKQELVAARFLLYDGTRRGDSGHFADRQVLLQDTQDYPEYGLSVEKTKAAFRIVHSILDKVAFFLNHYLQLGIEQRHVYFRTFWYLNRDRKKGLLPSIKRRENWPLRGLFWLSKDLYDETVGFKDALEPDAQIVCEVRNRLEHKYLKLHSKDWQGHQTEEDRAAAGMRDPLALSLRLDDFEAKALRLTKMARAALIYLSLAIQGEERARAKSRRQDAIIPGLMLDSLDGLGGRWEAR